MLESTGQLWLLGSVIAYRATFCTLWAASISASSFHLDLIFVHKNNFDKIFFQNTLYYGIRSHSYLFSSCYGWVSKRFSPHVDSFWCKLLNEPTHPLVTSFCIDDIYGGPKIDILTISITSELLTYPPPCVRMMDKIDHWLASENGSYSGNIPQTICLV